MSKKLFITFFVLDVLILLSSLFFFGFSLFTNQLWLTVLTIILATIGAWEMPQYFKIFKNMKHSK